MNCFIHFQEAPNPHSPSTHLQQGAYSSLSNSAAFHDSSDVTRTDDADYLSNDEDDDASDEHDASQLIDVESDV